MGDAFLMWQDVGGQAVPAGAQHGAVEVRFYERSVKDEVRSRNAGKPVYVAQTWMSKRFPGDRTQQNEYRVTDEIKEEFAREWAKYQATRAETEDGTPLRTWPMVDIGNVETLAAQKIYTVETLAKSDEKALTLLGPEYVTLKQRAHDWLRLSAGHDVAAELRAKVDALEAELRAARMLEQQHLSTIAELQRDAATLKDVTVQAAARGQLELSKNGKRP